MWLVINVVYAAIGVVALIAIINGIALLSHRVIYGRWRGSDPEQQQRGSYATVVMVLVVWILTITGVSIVWPFRLEPVFGVSLLVYLGVLLGCVKDYGAKGL
jgi:hypothetical protein